MSPLHLEVSRSAPSEGSEAEGGPPWTREQEELLTSWVAVLEDLREYHARAASALWGWDLALTVPVLLATAIFSVLFAAQAVSPEGELGLMIGADAIQTVRSLLGLSDEAARHEAAVQECWRLYSEISFQLAIPADKRVDGALFVHAVQGPFNAVVAEAGPEWKGAIGAHIFVRSIRSVRNALRKCGTAVRMLRNP